MSGRLIGYQARKAAQVAAYFAMRDGGTVNKLKLSKLLYLAERESMAARGRPLFYDEYYSLKDGPICSNALNGVNGKAGMTENRIWGDYVTASDARTVVLKAPADQLDLDELSRSDRKLLDAVWEKFGWMAPSAIRRWTHEHCQEYSEISEGRLPISVTEVYAALGYENTDEMVASVNEHRSVDATLSK